MSSLPAIVERISHHLRHLSYAAGRKRVVGVHRFKLQGYFPNRFSTHDRHEPHLDALISRLLRQRSGAFIDVGVNVGQTLCKVLAADRHRRYVGFEPQLACCFYVSQFIRSNKLDSASIVPLALGSSSALQRLHACSDFDEMASTTEPGVKRHALTSTLVPVWRGDDFLEQLHIDEVCVIKIDVEGAELQVLQGFSRTLERQHPALIFEVLPNFVGADRQPVPPSLAADRRGRAEEILRLLHDGGYVVYQVLSSGEAAQVDHFELDDSRNFVGWDYLALAASERIAT